MPRLYVTFGMERQNEEVGGGACICLARRAVGCVTMWLENKTRSAGSREASRSLVLGMLFGLLEACASVPALSELPKSTACANAEFRQFDFWIGDWDVTQEILQADGSWIELPARTEVAVSPDGCLLTEHWNGRVQFFWEGMQRPEAMWGFSLRRYDPATSAWSIYWMDQRNPRFETPHVGRFDGDHGEFFREFTADGQLRRTRIRFTQVSDTQVDWSLAFSADSGDTWRELWRMRMRRHL
jgi:hypothetical protein